MKYFTNVMLLVVSQSKKKKEGKRKRHIPLLVFCYSVFFFFPTPLYLHFFFFLFLFCFCAAASPAKCVFKKVWASCLFSPQKKKNVWQLGIWKAPIKKKNGGFESELQQNQKLCIVFLFPAEFFFCCCWFLVVASMLLVNVIFFFFASWYFHEALDTPSSFERNDIAVTFWGVFCFSLFSAQLRCTQLSRSPQWPLAVRNCWRSTCTQTSIWRVKKSAHITFFKQVTCSIISPVFFFFLLLSLSPRWVHGANFWEIRVVQVVFCSFFLSPDHFSCLSPSVVVLFLVFFFCCCCCWMLMVSDACATAVVVVVVVGSFSPFPSPSFFFLFSLQKAKRPSEHNNKKKKEHRFQGP